ncbi:haloacid dehalogenase-like hydrolase [Streptosporangiaceae bacterium NEAU-GS5]|nr:haloacid dehalogenase-like hydrolase [Streptosporangiaceae bacterium NEAU-GS5]
MGTDHKLVLWDIDHTLIETGGVGSEVFGEAFHEVTGVRMKDMASVAGRTEPVIFRETLDMHHVTSSDGLFERFADAQARGYERRADEMRVRGRVLPGAIAALQTLARQSGITQSVLTGNTRKSAQVKLRAFGLDSFLDLDIGAYGEDDPVRAHLVSIAQQRAHRQRKHTYSADSTVLIGDTPQDVAAAREGGARIIAVASGSSSAAELKDAGADIVFPDLIDSSALIRALAV